MIFPKISSGDKIIMTFIIMTGCLLGAFCLFFGKSGAYVKVTVDGKSYGQYSLLEDRIVEINGHNTIQIKDGYVFMSQATCPDGLCMKMGNIDKNGQSIICLPNKVVVLVVANDKKNEVDVIAQ